MAPYRAGPSAPQNPLRVFEPTELIFSIPCIPLPLQIDEIPTSLLNTHARRRAMLDETKACRTLCQGKQWGATRRDAGKSIT
jgi:hypothetical protein